MGGRTKKKNEEKMSHGSTKIAHNKKKNKKDDAELSKVAEEEEFDAQEQIEEGVHLEAAAISPGCNGKMSPASCESTENA